MPPIVAIVVGIGLALGAGPVFGVVGSLLLFNTMVGIGLTLTLGGISRAIRGSPNLSALSVDSMNHTVTSRQPISTGRVIYGTVGQVGGVLTYLQTSGTNNEYLHMVITLAAHELNSIDTMYFDNVSVPLNGSGDCVSGTFNGLVHVEKNTGSRDQAAFPGLVSASGGLWTSNHRQRGRAGVYVRLKWDQNAFPHGVPNITFDVTGRKVRSTAAATLAVSSDAALCLADYLADSTYGLGALKRFPLTAAMLSGSGLGAFNAANLVDGDYSTVGFNTDAAIAGAFLLIDAGAGNTIEPVELRIYTTTGAYAGQFNLDYSDDNVSYTNGIVNNLPNLGKLGVANKFRVPYLGAHRYWHLYLGNTPGAGADITAVELYESLVNKTQLADAVSTCEEDVSLAAGGTEKRYTVNGAFDSAETPSDLITALAGAMAGYMVYEGGQFMLWPGKYRTPDASLDFNENDLAGPLKVTTRISRRSTFNSVRGTYVSANSNWQPTNFPVVTNPAYVTEDQGEVIYLDATLPFTTSNATAQRISKIELERARRQITVQARFKFSAYKMRCQDVIKLSNTRYGWTQKTFEVKQVQLTTEAGEDNAPVLYVDATLRETDSNIFDWNPANDELTPAGVSPISVVTLRTAQPVTGLAVAAHDIVATDGAHALAADLSWTSPADQFVVNGGKLHIYLKLHTDSGWIEYAVLAGNQTSCRIVGITPAVAYDYKVVAENTAKVLSVDAILSSQTLMLSASGMLTYRPLSNPLTATDAGTTATVTIAGFTMRIQGVGDKSLTGSSITGLAFDSLFYVYYDDPQLLGGLPSGGYQATATKETALNGAGRFFVGSIRTPVDGGPDTSGYDDGGSGAQIGMISVGLFAVASASGQVPPSDPNGALDGDPTTACHMIANGNSTVRVSALALSNVPPLKRSFSSVKLKVDCAVPTNSVAGAATNTRASITWQFSNGDPATGTLLSLAKGVTQSRQILSADLPAKSNLSSLALNAFAQATTSDSTGTVELDIYDAWVEFTE